MENASKKIDVVVKYFYPVAAGIETNVLETYFVAAEKGYDVTVHTSKDIHTQKNILPNTDMIRGLPVLRYPFTTFGYSPKINWKETDIVALHNFDIFPHVWILLRALYLKLIGKKKFALMVTPHGGFNPEWSMFPLIQRVIKYTYHYTLGVMLINAVVDGVRAVSEWEKKEMIKKGLRAQLIQVIDNGIEDEAYMDVEALASPAIKSVVAELGEYIIQIGRIYPIKNYETTITALSKIPGNLKFAIMGSISNEAYHAKLQEQIVSLGLSDRVVFLGVVRSVDKYYVLKKAQMMVHMALWESYCNVVHEGLSQGLPCIVANNTALPLLIQNDVYGYCVDTLDADMVAEKIQFILENKNTQKILEMKERNKAYGLQNSWRQVSEKMTNFYEVCSSTLRI